MTTKCYFVTSTAATFAAAALEERVFGLFDVIDYGEYATIAVTCYDFDLPIVENVLAPFV